MEGTTTQDLIRRLSDRLGYSEEVVETIVNRFFEETCNMLASERTVELRRFGTFAVVQRPPRTVEHPVSGKKVDIPARLAVTFRSGTRLTSRVQIPGAIREILDKNEDDRPAGSDPVQPTEPEEAPKRSTLAEAINDPKHSPSSERSSHSVLQSDEPVLPIGQAKIQTDEHGLDSGDPFHDSPVGIGGTTQKVATPRVDTEPRPIRSQEESAPDVQFGARVLCVTSGKGGTGKSFTVCNLAVRMASLGKRVILLDADLGLANLHLLLGVNPRYNLSHVLSGELALIDIMEEGPCGIQLISGGSGVVRLANLKSHELVHFVQGLADLEQHADLIIIDTAAGISPRTVAFLAASREILLVTTPDITAMTDAYAILKTVAHSGRKSQTVSLIVNQASDPAEAQAVQDRLEGVSRKFLGRELESLGFIYDDPAVSRAVAMRTPLILAEPGSRAAQGIVRLAKKISESKLPPQNPRRYADRLRGFLVNQAI